MRSPAHNCARPEGDRMRATLHRVQVLAIDLGKTGCRVLRRDSDGQQFHGEAGGALGMAHPDGLRSAMQAIDQALQAGAVPAGGLDAVCLGAAGVAAAPEAASAMAALLA